MKKMSALTVFELIVKREGRIPTVSEFMEETGYSKQTYYNCLKKYKGEVL